MTDEEAISFAWEMYILNQDADWYKVFSYLIIKYEKEHDKRFIFKSSLAIKNERH